MNRRSILRRIFSPGSESCTPPLLPAGSSLTEKGSPGGHMGYCSLFTAQSLPSQCHRCSELLPAASSGGASGGGLDSSPDPLIRLNCGINQPNLRRSQRRVRAALSRSGIDGKPRERRRGVRAGTRCITREPSRCSLMLCRRKSARTQTCLHEESRPQRSP